jgi:hypothetical protein
MRVLAVLLLAAGLGLGVAAPALGDSLVLTRGANIWLSKKAPRRARKLSATLTLAFTPRGGKATSVSRKVSLRR